MPAFETALHIGVENGEEALLILAGRVMALKIKLGRKYPTV